MTRLHLGHMLCVLVLGGICFASSPAIAAGNPVKIEWFSWSIFRMTSPTGKVVLTNPFVTNPDSPAKVEDSPKADVIVVADGHQDEVDSTAEIALATRPRSSRVSKCTACGLSRGRSRSIMCCA